MNTLTIRLNQTETLSNMTEISVVNEAINTPSQECNEDTDFSIRRNK